MMPGCRVQKVEDKPWKNEEFKRMEEALPMSKERDLERVARLYKAKTGVGCGGIHPKVLLDLTEETRVANGRNKLVRCSS